MASPPMFYSTMPSLQKYMKKYLQVQCYKNSLLVPYRPSGLNPSLLYNRLINSLIFFYWFWAAQQHKSNVYWCIYIACLLRLYCFSIACISYIYCMCIDCLLLTKEINDNTQATDKQYTHNKHTIYTQQICNIHTIDMQYTHNRHAIYISPQLHQP